MSPIDKSMLERYLRGACTPEEEDQVHRWFDLNDAAEFPSELSERVYAYKERKIWRRLTHSLEGLNLLPARRRIAYMKVARYAAAVAILVVAAWWVNEQTSGALWWKGARYATEYGEIKRISLPDGSVVTLNAMSELKVPEEYGKQERGVYLKGEAYFLVKKDTVHAFTVYSRNISTTALGTTFNVSAYREDRRTIVSLHEGRVAVNKTKPESGDVTEMILKPGEEVIYSANGRFIKKTFSQKERLSWKEQVLYFQDAGLPEVIHKLERHYGVTFDYGDLENASWKLTGEYRHLSLKDVLESLSFSYKIKYTIKGNKVILTK